METLGVRLKRLRNSKKITQQKLADAIGVSKTSVIYWEKDENTPKHDSLTALAKVLGTTTDWLTSGKEGDAPARQEDEREIFSNVRPTKRKLRKIPVLDFVQAGMWREVVYDGMHPKDETFTTYEGRDPNAVFSLEVDGLSMAPDFMPGDEIVVDAALEPKPGSLVVAQEIQHGAAMTTFKKYRVVGVNEHGVDIIELVPLNPDFPTYNSAQIEISIIGVVVQHHKDFKY
ncbi:LexA family protein [Acinetobacter lwoffii]|uniref:LexA family protein n=1 Tax=Acinetobacter lwoffii TaxID=28090 RepID=UPI0021CD574C|nr:S24 family peptidase [Acinetobacter lwoffii]MCU4419849.1 helix-turn-helix domain-containing protein [Acinetobacter lwoffii]